MGAARRTKYANRITAFCFTMSFGVLAVALSIWLTPVPPPQHHMEAPAPRAPAPEPVAPEETSVPNAPRPPQIVQTQTVVFPVNGPVRVQAVEEDGEFPRMVFVSKRTGKTLLSSTIIDADRFLRHDVDGLDSFPQLRFRRIDAAGFRGPVIMSVGIYHGGSDNGYYMDVFGEVGGKIRRLTPRPLGTAIQGGFFLGKLNDRLGSGLAVWGFIWGDGESHYERHHYRIDIYNLRGNCFVKTKQYRTRRKYFDNESQSLTELGITAADQRTGIPEIKDSLE